MDVWGKLWEIAAGEAAGPATIYIDPEDCGQVTLEWPDGTQAALYWHEGEWRFHESLNTCPGDIAARDTF